LKTGAIIIEGHVQGLSNTRALGSKGIPVYVVDINTCIARYSRYCEKFFICPSFKTDELADFLIELAIKEKIKDWILIPSNDHAVKTLSRNRIRLMEFYKVITPDESIINNIYDKSKLFEIAGLCGVPIPNTIYFDDIDEVETTLTFPVITKGREGLNFYKATGKKAFISENLVELKQLLKEIDTKVNIRNTLTQEVIPFNGSNKTISFTAFCDEGEIKTYWIGEKIREHPVRFGTATYCVSIHCAELLELSKPLLNRLNYTGVCEVEFLFDPRDGKYKLIEINARSWLWVGLARACGIDYARLIYNHSNGNANEFPADYKVGVKWINYLTDTYISSQMILKGDLSLKEYLKSLRGKKVRAVFKWSDILPGFMLVFLSFYLAKKRII
jgi:predicted ATP-grasp superfamily ATP-dependent carboligase